MKIFKTQPNDSKQWQSDAPSVQAMRFIKPVVGILSAFSIACAVVSFFQISFTSPFGIALLAGASIAGWFYDDVAITAICSVVREGMLALKGETTINLIFWVNMALSAVIGSLMVYGSYTFSQTGISSFVLEIRQAIEVKAETNEDLAATATTGIDRNAGTLEAIRTANEAQQAAINAKYAGKLEALEAEIARREAQRNEDNKYYIAKKIAEIRTKIGEVKAEQGEALAELATEFAAKQEQYFAKSDTLQSVIVADALAASDRQKQLQKAKDEKDKEVSSMISGIFAYSIVLLTIISVRLTILETRNDILPNPILSNADLSGAMMPIRFLMTIPNFLYSCLHAVSEWFYRVAPKHRTPVMDNDLIDFKAAQMGVTAIRKEGKIKKLPETERRKIGYDLPGIAAETEGKELPHARARVTESVTGKTESAKAPTGNCLNCGAGFVKTVPHKKYCSDNCRLEYHAGKHGGQAFDITKQRKKK